MIFQWVCECEEVNQTNMDKWKMVKDGQGFKAVCEGCNKEKEIDIEVKIADSQQILQWRGCEIL